ncbi:hypothetical protein BME24068_03382 [Burkholderia metallica]|nr:hypothetical protein BME24068_03382 [Burkholderia metallica]
MLSLLHKSHKCRRLLGRIVTVEIVMLLAYDVLVSLQDLRKS